MRYIVSDVLIQPDDPEAETQGEEHIEVPDPQAVEIGKLGEDGLYASGVAAAGVCVVCLYNGERMERGRTWVKSILRFPIPRP